MKNKESKQVNKSIVKGCIVSTTISIDFKERLIQRCADYSTRSIPFLMNNLIELFVVGRFDYLPKKSIQEVESIVLNNDFEKVRFVIRVDKKTLINLRKASRLNGYSKMSDTVRKLLQAFVVGEILI